MKACCVRLFYMCTAAGEACMLIVDSLLWHTEIGVYHCLCVCSYKSLKAACDCYNEALDSVLRQVSLRHTLYNLSEEMQFDVFATRSGL